MSHRRVPALASLFFVLAAACAPVAPSASGGGAAVGSPSPSPTSTPRPSIASPDPTPSATPTPTPDPYLSPIGDLTGLTVDPVVAHRTPLAVMLDDSRAARPQSGFNAASIVYQATADGYETRYMLVFQEFDADKVGPVRSARFFLTQWASETKSALGHYGGDQRTRRHIKHNPEMFTDVDGLGKGAKAYHRIKSRSAPHNAYTSTASIRKVATRLGMSERLSRRIHLRPFRDPSAVADRGESQRIRIPYPTNVITYRYDRATNRYLRSIDDKAHRDAADGERVAPTNVVVLYQKFRIDTKVEPGHSRPDITTLGSGKALIFREGTVVKATWHKEGDVAPTLLLDRDGQEIPLVRGQTFIQVVPTSTKVTYGD